MVSLQNEWLQIDISALGAEINRVRSKKEDMEYVWDGDPDYWSGHAPVLFPIVGRLNENTYLHKGKSYQMNQHGFARRLEWVLEEAGEEHAVFVLHADEQTKEQYPFDFALRVFYTLAGQTIQISYEVQNLSEEKMPYSLGSHPAFYVPLEEGKKWEDYEVAIDPVSTLNQLEVGPIPFLNGSKKPFLPLKDGKMALNRSLLQESLLLETDGAVETVTLEAAGSRHGVRLHVSQFPYVCFWTKEGTKAPFLCIEPFHGLPDIAGEPGELSDKKGITLLEPQETKRHDYSIDFY